MLRRRPYEVTLDELHAIASQHTLPLAALIYTRPPVADNCSTNCAGGGSVSCSGATCGIVEGKKCESYNSNGFPVEEKSCSQQAPFSIAARRGGGAVHSAVFRPGLGLATPPAPGECKADCGVSCFAGPGQGCITSAEGCTTFTAETAETVYKVPCPPVVS